MWYCVLLIRIKKGVEVEGGELGAEEGRGAGARGGLDKEMELKDVKNGIGAWKERGWGGEGGGALIQR